MFGLFKKNNEVEKSDGNIIEMNGIRILNGESSKEKKELIKKIVAIYPKKHKEIAEFLLQNGITEYFGEMTSEELGKKLGNPTIDLESKQIIYSRHKLDEEHIISVEYSGLLDKLLYCSIDG